MFKHDASSSNTYNNSCRVEPNFFGHSIETPTTADKNRKRKVDNHFTTTGDVGVPPPENPYYVANSPPSYSEATVSTAPSAPPIEPPASNTPALSHPTPYYPPYPPEQRQGQQQQQQPYYGSTMSSHNIAIQANSQWPWVQPSTVMSPPAQQQLLPPNDNYPPQPPLPLLSAADNGSRRSSPRKSLFCHIFIIALMIGFILYSVGTYSPSWNHDIYYYCRRATHTWDEFPSEFDFEPQGGLIVQVHGHGSSTGRINIIRDGQKDATSIKGHVRSTAFMSSTSSPSPQGLKYDLTQLKNETTLLSIWIPASICIELDTVISLPHNQTVRLMDIQVANSNVEIDIGDDEPDDMDGSSAPATIRDLRLKTSNKDITIHSQRKGDTMWLETTNAHIALRNHVSLTSDLYLLTTNGGISFTDSIHARSIKARTTNANIDHVERLTHPVLEKDRAAVVLNATDTLQLRTSNGHVNLPSVQIIANQSYIQSRNGPIRVNHAVIGSDIRVETSNAPIDLHVKDIERQSGNLQAVASSVNVHAQTSNARISVTAPLHHEGPLQLDTSSSNNVEVVDPLQWTKLDYVHKGHVKGYRQRPVAADTLRLPKAEAVADGRIQLQTSNAGVHLEFRDDNNV